MIGCHSTHSISVFQIYLPSLFNIAMDPAGGDFNEGNNSTNDNNPAHDPADQFDDEESAIGNDLVTILNMFSTFSEMERELDQQQQPADDGGHVINNGGGVGEFMEQYLMRRTTTEGNNGILDDEQLSGFVVELTRHIDAAMTRAQNTYEDRRRRGPIPASESAIERLEKVTVVEQKQEGEGGTIMEKLECPICCEDFSNDPDAARMPCSHLFHFKCLSGWLHTCNTCPLCRRQLPP